jgi:hypothetical protein
MSLTLVPAELKYADEIGTNLRGGDLLELVCMGYEGGPEAVRALMKRHRHSVVCLEDGRPIAAWGYEPAPYVTLSIAYVWCVTAEGVNRHKKDILAMSRGFVERLQEQFHTLESAVSPEYPQSERWTRWLGFVPVRRFMSGGIPFDVIVRNRT